MGRIRFTTLVGEREYVAIALKYYSFFKTHSHGYFLHTIFKNKIYKTALRSSKLFYLYIPRTDQSLDG